MFLSNFSQLLMDATMPLPRRPANGFAFTNSLLEVNAYTSRTRIFHALRVAAELLSRPNDDIILLQYRSVMCQTGRQSDIGRR